MRDELLNGEILYSMKVAQFIIEKWRKHYNTIRPHSALGYRPPTPESIIAMDQRSIMYKHSYWTNQWWQAKALLVLYSRPGVLPLVLFTLGISGAWMAKVGW